MLKLIRYALITALAMSSYLAFSKESVKWESSIASGVAFRQLGKMQLSIDQLTEASQTADTTEGKMRAAGELGASLLQARRLNDAEKSLKEAYIYFSGTEHARYALDLGNLAVISKRKDEAQTYYEEAVKLAGSDTEINVIADLNLARLTAESKRFKKLSAVFPKIDKIQDKANRARFYLNLGNQARELGDFTLSLTYQSLDKARQLAAKDPSLSRLQVEILDALAQTYEDHGRKEDALTLTRQAITQARALDNAAVGDLLINLEWRQGRLQKLLNRKVLALAAFQRAVDQIELIRQDIPIDYEDGRSSFRNTLSPIYLGLADLLLQESDKQTQTEQEGNLRRVRDTVELIKQSELQDYLGDRCTVDTIKGGGAEEISAGTAILYPIIFADRIELLLETKSGITHYSSQIPGATVRQTAVGFAADLRNGDAGYMMASKKLYDWLLRPIDEYAATQHIKTLVVVPDGALRLVAMGALNDGNQFAIEKYAITTVTGLSMTNTNKPSSKGWGLLVAGVSEPGPVVDKLSQATVDQIFGSDSSKKDTASGVAANRSMRSLKLLSVGELSSTKNSKKSSKKNGAPNMEDAAIRSQTLREALSLPGVKQEVEAIKGIMSSTSMLNSAFTVDGFRQEAESGTYNILHIATHGVFGGSADTSYILAYDDLLTLNGLQSMLKSDHFRKNPIELLTMSACETAEGDERSPLGISGAAMKARARSVLGTLWPVDDIGARKMMETFYRGLSANHLSKAEALQRSQVELLHSEGYSHPVFWAPFVLIGNWL